MSDGRRGFVPGGLFVGALVARLGWVFLGGGDALAFSNDAMANHDLAINVVERHQFATTIDPPHRLDVPYAQRPPLTPFALAAAYIIFGPDLLVGQLLLASLGALSVVGVYLLGKRLFSARVALVAGILAALYPFFVFLVAIPLTENLAILLYTFLAWLLTTKSGRGSIKHAAVTGCVLGLAALNRPQILGFLPLLVVLVLADVEHQRWRQLTWLGVALVSAALILGPWTVRNRMVLGAWFPISLQGGAVLYQGNNPYTQTPLTKLRNGERGWYNDTRLGAELTGLLPLDADRKAFGLAVAFMRDHPGQTFLYSVQKVGLFFRAYDHLVARASWYPVLALSLLGFLWTAPRWRELLPLYLLVVQTLFTAALFTSMPRFRAPVEPVFLLMAAVALERLWARRTAGVGRG